LDVSFKRFETDVFPALVAPVMITTGVLMKVFDVSLSSMIDYSLEMELSHLMCIERHESYLL
jgi:hypothetical protein